MMTLCCHSEHDLQIQLRFTNIRYPAREQMRQNGLTCKRRSTIKNEQSAALVQKSPAADGYLNCLTKKYKKIFVFVKQVPFVNRLRPILCV